MGSRAWNPSVAEREFVLFDFDGTIADTMPTIVSTARRVLREWGLTDEEIGDARRLVGPPFPGAFSQVYGLSEADAAEVTRRYRAIYNNLGPETYPTFDGIPELLDRLRAAGKRLAVATSKNDALAQRMVRDQGIADKFDAIVGKVRDGLGAKRIVISDALAALGAAPDRAVMVGDRFYDVEGALEVGMPCVGVMFGTATREELEGAGAAAVVGSCDELAQVLLG